jgi:3-isopropylmalate/(R)-2-methylmalate dehydratase small subunit
VIEGRALVYRADDVNTDGIWPGKYTYVQMDRAEMPKYAMENFEADFGAKVASRSILVVGKNFGCGSSREQASECLLASGVEAIVATSFARIFYRNSINLGLPVIECPEAVKAIEDGAQVEIDLERGELRVAEQRFAFPRYPAFVLELIQDGGLIAHIAKSPSKNS